MNGTLRALEKGLNDTDASVSSYARSMLKGLAGDSHALAMVDVRGESVP